MVQYGTRLHDSEAERYQTNQAGPWFCLVEPHFAAEVEQCERSKKVDINQLHSQTFLDWCCKKVEKVIKYVPLGGWGSWGSALVDWRVGTAMATSLQGLRLQRLGCLCAQAFVTVWVCVHIWKCVWLWKFECMWPCVSMYVCMYMNGCYTHFYVCIHVCSLLLYILHQWNLLWGSLSFLLQSCISPIPLWSQKFLFEIVQIVTGPMQIIEGSDTAQEGRASGQGRTQDKWEWSQANSNWSWAQLWKFPASRLGVSPQLIVISSTLVPAKGATRASKGGKQVMLMYMTVVYRDPSPTLCIPAPRPPT